MISTFDLFKVGIGPSSSHTVGPMVAGRNFCLALEDQCSVEKIFRLQVDIHGSLALTGKGHRTDVAIVLGLAGFLPQTIDVEVIEPFIETVKTTQKLLVNQTDHEIHFDINKDIVFNNDALPLHENGLKIHAFAEDNTLIFKETYYSIGGGFILTEAELLNSNKKGGNSEKKTKVPYDFHSAEELLKFCQENNLTISELVLKNELTLHSYDEIVQYFSHIWVVMQACIERGMQTEGHLPGPLNVPRRAAPLFKLLTHEQNDEIAKEDPLIILDWVNLFAIAVNEENAAGSRVVTAPTNGASGIIPAVLTYYDRFISPLDEEKILSFFLTTAAIGILYKKNASISGAEVGCQGEVGVACSMAAGGLAALQGATPEQVCIAAEIGMEHNLGLTCDPVAGQVQIPCIERNAIGATKAINSSRMAMKRSGSPSVSLDKVIETMFETGKDINVKYRETSLGGLAVVLGHGNVIQC